jgi:hypothetical protein
LRILHVPEVGTAELDINAKVIMIWMNYSEILFYPSSQFMEHIVRSCNNKHSNSC